MKKLLMLALILIASTANANNRWVNITDTMDMRIGLIRWIDVNWIPHTSNPNIRVYNYYSSYSNDLEISQGVSQIDCKLKIENVLVIHHTNKNTGLITKTTDSVWQSFNLIQNEYAPYQLICR